MATYDEPFHIYRSDYDRSTSLFLSTGLAGALPVSSTTEPDRHTRDFILYYNVPAVADLTNVAVALYLDPADVANTEVSVIDPEGSEPTMFASADVGGSALGTASEDATFDISADAPPYFTYPDWAYIEPPPLAGRWQAFTATRFPTGAFMTSWYGQSFPASSTTIREDQRIFDCWAIHVRLYEVETSPDFWETLPLTIHRAALIINEPHDYDSDDTLDTSTGGTTGGVSGTGKPGLGVGSGGVNPVATGSSAPPSGGTGGGSAGGIVYPASGGRPASRDVDGLVFRVTGMYRPDGTMTAKAVLLPDFTDGEVEIPSYNDARIARVTVSMGAFDGVQAIRARERMLQVWFRGVLVFWGTIVTRARNFEKGTITFAARDPSLRLERHFLRAGDLDGTVDDIQGHTFPLAVDGIGMRLLRDAADNTPDQDTAEYPVLGIANGDLYTPDTAGLMEVRRGDQVWSQMQTSANHMIGPDLRLRPTADDPGAYVLLDTYERMGTDRATAVGFDCGWGLDNAENIEHEEGAQLITHAHSLDRDLKYRFTEANTTAAALYGVYVEWDATEYDTETISEEQAETILRAHARAILGAYSRPLETIKITPRPGAAARFIYLRDFYDGDTVRFAAKRGYDSVYGTARVTKVTLTDPGNNVVKQSLETVSSFVPDIELGGSEDA